MGVYGGVEPTWASQTNVGRTHIATKGIVQSGLVLNLDAGVPSSYSGSGTTWTDLSGNGNDGTLINGVGFDGVNGGSLVFDGVDDGVNCGTESLPGLISFSGILWIYRTALTRGRLLTRRSFAQGSGWWDFLVVPEGPLGDFVEKGGIEFNADFLTTDIRKVSLMKIDIDKWNMVGFTWDGGSSSTGIKLYVNGLEVEADLDFSVDGEGGRVAETTNSLVIGNADWANRPYSGYISSVQVYNRVLTTTEIQQNFIATKSRFGF